MLSVLCFDLADPFGTTQASKFALALYSFAVGFVLIALVGNKKKVALVLIVLGVFFVVAANIMWGLAIASMGEDKALLQFNSEGSWEVHYLPILILGGVCILFGLGVRIVPDNS